MESPGEKLLIKLWETLTEKGIGALLTPWQIRRTERARLDVRREEKLVLAQTERDAADILAGRKTLADVGGRLVALPAPRDQDDQQAERPQIAGLQDRMELLQDAASKFSAREVQRYVNLQRIALHAEEQASQATDDSVSNDPIDTDWLNRWRENAQDVSVEHMQRVWARILTEELKSPGSYSMDTLEFLRTLSKTEALKIAVLGPFVFQEGWIFRNAEFLERVELNFGALLELQELGIISGVEAIGGLQTIITSVEKSRFQIAIRSNGKALVFERDAKEPPLEIPIYRLTRRGKEIMRLGDYTANEIYMRAIGKYVKDKGFKVKLGDWQQVSPDRGTLKSPVEL